MHKQRIQSIRDQLSRYSVALISMVLALTSLGYNTWRNEKTEANRNIRVAGIEMILAMGKLHEVVFFSHYDDNDQLGDVKRGWVVVLSLLDLSMTMPDSVKKAAKRLHATWTADSAQLDDSETSLEQINSAIDQLRHEILLALEALE
ncbi:MAG: hypothetical protein O6931_08200 [Gammaproteobacteria bacterium]|nr:hypothetical protein [Gammaproteobacteria bacterium]